MAGELESYFDVVGGLGRRVIATDRQQERIEVGAALKWTVAESERTKREGGRVFFVGNGGSAAVASHMAADWMRNGGFSSLALNDGAALTCFANDFGYEQVFAAQLARHAQPGDLVFAISSSGRSANILAAVRAARGKLSTVVTLTGFDEANPLRAAGDLNFYIPSDLYGFVEIAHLAICHAVLDVAMGWRADGAKPAYVTYGTEPAT